MKEKTRSFYCDNMCDIENHALHLLSNCLYLTILSQKKIQDTRSILFSMPIDLTSCARLCNSCVMAVLRSVLAIGDVLATSLRGVAYVAVEVSVVLLVTLLDPPPFVDP